MELRELCVYCFICLLLLYKHLLLCCLSLFNLHCSQLNTVLASTIETLIFAKFYCRNLLQSQGLKFTMSECYCLHYRPSFRISNILLQIHGCHGTGLFRAFNQHVLHRMGVQQDGPLVRANVISCFIAILGIIICGLAKISPGKEHSTAI